MDLELKQAERILITGGSGFLGQALGRRFREAGHEVLLASRNQSSLIEAGAKTNCKIKFCDVASHASVEDAFCDFKPSIVIHAAASKHVEAAEVEPLECIDINVLGSQKIARAAIRHEAKIVIAVSTDKAAAPAMTTYGISKALMERCFATLDKTNNTRFGVVRLGNLAWSSGSVFPLWHAMQQRGKVILSSGPDMRRFFMHVDEAVDLVFAQINSIEVTSGKVLVPKLKAAQISDILDVWIGHWGGSWEKDGLRRGDYPDQWLIGAEELVHTRSTRLNNKDVFLIDFSSEFPVMQSESVSTLNAERFTPEEIKELISRIPDYV